MSTGVDKISRCFFGAAGFEASCRFLMDGIVNDCSVISVLELYGVDWGCDGAVETLPKVDCTKFVEFLKSFVKLLVLNDNKPLDVDDDAVETDAFDVAFSVGVESALPRMDFVLWLNIILTFFSLVKSSCGSKNSPILFCLFGWIHFCFLCFFLFKGVKKFGVFLSFWTLLNVDSSHL